MNYIREGGTTVPDASNHLPLVMLCEKKNPLSIWLDMDYLTIIVLEIIYLFDKERERERESTCTSSGRDRRGSRGRDRFPTEQGAQCRTRSQDPGIMT